MQASRSVVKGSVRSMAAVALAFAAVLALAAGGAVMAQGAAVAAGDGAARPRVLVFSKTAGFRHKSIPDGIAALRAMAEGRWELDATEDAAAFTPDNLRRYGAVVFLSTTGDVLDGAQQAAFEGYIRGGGAWVGVHAATDTEYEWPWYGRLAGAWFLGHPRNQDATVRVEDREHRSTRMLPAEWKRFDEWYAFRQNPRAGVHVLATLDEKSYDPEKAPMGADHPIAWCHEFDGGRAWYTAGGHTSESFKEALFLDHLRGGIEWAMKVPEQGGAKPAGGVAPVAEPAGAGGGKGARASVAGRGGVLLAQAAAGPSLGAMPLVWMLGGLWLLAAVVLGATGEGVRAPLLGWLFPGLGHLSIGERKRGLLAMAAVGGMFLTGLAVGGVDAVDSVEDGPWFIAQSANGPIAIGADLVNQHVLKKGKVGELLPAPVPTDAMGRPLPGNYSVSSYKGLGSANEFGTLFIALGGLLNLVLVMDVSRRV